MFAEDKSTGIFGGFGRAASRLVLTCAAALLALAISAAPKNAKSAASAAQKKTAGAAAKGAGAAAKSSKSAAAKSAKSMKSDRDALDKWKLAYTEDFKGMKLNEKLWSRIDKGGSDWNRNMSLRPDLVKVKDGQLHLYGVRNTDKSEDPRAVLTGGVKTQGKFAMTYGKVEIRCKLEGARGAWPAIWMMPNKNIGPWPDCGEIDIVERLNHDDFVYQTVHSGWPKPGKDNSYGGKGKIKPNDFNVYGLEWTPEEIKWFVNGAQTYSYKKSGNDRNQFPWDYPFYLMIDMQLGGRWVGAVDEAALPVAMHIDWVKFYSLTRGGKKISAFTKQ